MTPEVPTLRELVDAGAVELKGAEGAARDDPRREASLLLQAAVGLSPCQLVTRGDELVMAPQTFLYWDMVRDRARGIPLQLILGETDFHEIRLSVEPGVFIPRPETELLVEEAASVIDRLLPRPVRVLDLCTGTGAISVAIAVRYRERREVAVHAGDWSPRAVRLARHNAERNGVADQLDIRRSELFSAFADLEGKVDVLVSNPPYISRGELADLPLEVRLGDPEEALCDPGGGTGFHRRIARRGRDFLRPGGTLLLEIGERQGEEVASVLAGDGYVGVSVLEDLAGRHRFVRGVRPPGSGERQLPEPAGGRERSSTRSS